LIVSQKRTITTTILPAELAAIKQIGLDRHCYVISAARECVKTTALKDLQEKALNKGMLRAWTIKFEGEKAGRRPFFSGGGFCVRH
jgi:hypothetical protein